MLGLRLCHAAVLAQALPPRLSTKARDLETATGQIGTAQYLCAGFSVLCDQFCIGFVECEPAGGGLNLLEAPSGMACNHPSAQAGNVSNQQAVRAVGGKNLFSFASNMTYREDCLWI